VKQFVKWLMSCTPYRIVRDRGANRFQAIETCLQSLKARGYDPTVIIDGGAHLGSFTLAVRPIFPRASFHLIEPQPTCSTQLTQFCAQNGFIFHQCALADNAGTVPLSRTTSPSTGAHIRPEADTDTEQVTAARLDDLFPSLKENARALLKLDLQGYEMYALRGGTRLLRSGSIEVILCEVSFYAQAYEPSIAALTQFLHEHGFGLHDIASLAGRARDNRCHQGDFLFVRSDSDLAKDKRWN
jgi:FkbM family methyltransferase